MTHRKRLGLTQDALAEQLGVTAQAVSKWENDQSCPDIAMLPKLAEIFGISADELLGIQSQAVHTAEVVAEEENEVDGIHIQKGGWDFHWDGGRKPALGIALFVLLVGGLLLASNLLQWGASFWDIFWPSALVMFGLFGLFPRFSFFRTGCFLFGAYFLAANLGLMAFDIGKEVILPVLILLFGLSLLADALRKPKKPHFHIHHAGTGHSQKTKSDFKTGAESFECSMSFGEADRYVELPRLSRGEVSCSFGSMQIDLTGCEAFSDNCEIDASCSFGDLELIVPRCCRVIPDAGTAFGNLGISGQPDPDAPYTLHLVGHVSFGEISVRYV